MPQQEVFFELSTGDRRIEVLKIYDAAYAREAFDRMDDAAQSSLWQALKIDDAYDPADVPPKHDPDSPEFLWEELFEAAREDWNRFSFFVVNEAIGRHVEALYVSPDWPSAEAFAKARVAAVQ